MIGSFLLGISLSAIPFTRPNAIFLTPIIIIYILKLINNYRLILNFIFGALITSIINSYINIEMYDNILGGYSIFQKAISNLGIDLISGTISEGFLGLYFSPGFGLLVFSPVMIFSFVVFEYNIFVLFLYISIILYTLFLSKYLYWSGGYTYGPRLLTDLTPFFVLLIALSFKKFYHYKLYRYTFIFLTIYSFIIQFVGSYNQNIFSEWNGCDKRAIEIKAWDYKDLPFIYPLKKYRLIYDSTMEFYPQTSCMNIKYNSETNRYTGKNENGELKQLTDNWSLYIPKEKICMTISIQSSSQTTVLLNLKSKKKSLSRELQINPVDKNYTIEIDGSEINGVNKISLIQKGISDFTFNSLIFKKNSICN